MMMKAESLGVTVFALSVLFLSSCSGERTEWGRLHRAQQDFWRAKHAQQRLDIYPHPAIAEDCLARYQEIAGRYSPGDLPVEIDDPDGVPVKLARVGAMASLGAAGILRELGREEDSIAVLESVCRADLPLGAFIERRLRGSLASFQVEAGRYDSAATVYRSILSAHEPGLGEEHAAYPDEEVMAYPMLMLDLARDSGDARLIAEVSTFSTDYYMQVSRDYPGGDAEWRALLFAADLSIALEQWEEASAILERLALGFPDRQPWRAELRRARLLREQLGRSDESEVILTRWAEGSDPQASIEAGKQRIRLFMETLRFEEAEDEIRRVRKLSLRRPDKAELLYLWGVLELRRDSWDEARPRWGQAAVNHPYTQYGMESQLAVAEQWTERDEARFAALALGRLFMACRRNTRHHAGSELARISVEIESRADSLLGTLPATDPTVRNLLLRRGPHQEDEVLAPVTS